MAYFCNQKRSEEKKIFFNQKLDYKKYLTIRMLLTTLISNGHHISA